MCIKNVLILLLSILFDALYDWFKWSLLVCLELHRLVHNLVLSFFSFTTVMTGCFKRHDLILECMCFTIISTFNLIPSATGMTGRDGRKTQRLY